MRPPLAPPGLTDAGPREAVGLLRPIWHGALCLTLPMAIALLLRPFMAEGSPVLFALVILALVPGAYIATMVYPTRMSLVFAGIALMTLAPWPVVFGLEYRLVGTIPRMTVDEAAAGRLAAGFRLPDAVPRPDLQAVSVFENIDWTRPLPWRSGAVQGPTRIAIMPVTDPGWTREIPVRMVAVQDQAAAAHGARWPAPWAEAGGLLSMLPDGQRERRVRAMLRQAGLTAAPDLMLGRWAADPEAARWEEAALFLQVWAGCIAAWSLLILLGWPRARAQGHWGMP